MRQFQTHLQRQGRLGLLQLLLAEVLLCTASFPSWLFCRQACTFAALMTTRKVGCTRKRRQHLRIDAACLLAMMM
jgi:hypothetical protein